MKAEQRKELETNTLADKMGLVVQRVKTSPRRTFVTYTLITAAVLVAAWFGWRWYKGDVEGRSMQWIRFYDGAGSQIEFLASEKDTYAGKAAQFQIVWDKYWDDAMKMIGIDPRGSMRKLNEVVVEYSKLAELCKDDPIFEPQALLGRAVATESLAAQDVKHLEQAKKYYKELAEHEKYAKSGEGTFAKERLDILNDKDKSRALADEYVQIRILLGVPPDDRVLFQPGKAKLPPLGGKK